MPKSNIIEEAKTAKFHWLRHLESMGEHPAAKRVTERSDVRTDRSSDEVWKDLKEFGTHDWQEQSQNMGVLVRRQDPVWVAALPYALRL